MTSPIEAIPHRHPKVERREIQEERVDFDFAPGDPTPAQVDAWRDAWRQIVGIARDRIAARSHVEPA